jgi:hypothetical protein
MLTMVRTAKQDNETPPSRRNRAVAVGGDVRSLAQRAFERAGFRDGTLVLHWEEIAGSETARFSLPVKFVDGPDGGILTVRADAAASVFLHHESRELCARINSYLGRPAVKRLRFVFGEVPTHRPGHSQPRMRTPLPLDGDPALHFHGPTPLHEALISLAGARRLRTPEERD